MAPYGSIDSFASWTSLPGTGATVPDSACGFTFSLTSAFFSTGGGVAGGVGGAASFFLLSRDPTSSWLLYFLSMLSL